MNESVGLDDTLVSLHEVGGGQTFGSFFHLRVTESDPDLIDLIGRKELGDKLDLGAQERHILQSFLDGLLGTGPHAGALDIHPDEVLVRVFLG